MEAERYAELLAEEIPVNKRTDVAIEIYRRKLEGDGKKLTFIVKAIMGRLTDDQIAQFLQVVSDELKTTPNDSKIRYALQILNPNLWQRINEAARMRVENKLIRSIQTGKINEHNQATDGALGTWARRFLKYFTLKDEVGKILLNKLETECTDEQNYVTYFFLTGLPEVITTQYKIGRCVIAISKAIRLGNLYIRSQLVSNIDFLPEEWQNRFTRELKDLTNPDNPETYLLDGTPFLTLYPTDDDIPF